MFAVIAENQALISGMKVDCDIIVEYYCYMTDGSFVFHPSRERIDLISRIGACLAVEVYPTSK